ncbi:hypothetical protein RFI_35861 [Reticulomyxa filosa]|uniref:Uncharacterized protein n=1 Tax=Reticulomyxa filosa TaxID=46433 RepID=X6LKA7_RETFI|nr:hypothetical protein RFI_35861 [Reticulomyxa filosa]|eukprot:ETO01577.1 hypothetical protein RFI_35861 [Reticulomyxa filosa]
MQQWTSQNFCNIDIFENIRNKRLTITQFSMNHKEKKTLTGMSAQPNMNENPQNSSETAGESKENYSETKEDQKKTEGKPTYYYTDSDIPLTEEHEALLHRLKRYVDKVIKEPKKFEWQYDKNDSALFECQKSKPIPKPDVTSENKDDNNIYHISLSEWSDHINRVDASISSDHNNSNENDNVPFLINQKPPKNRYGIHLHLLQLRGGINIKKKKGDCFAKKKKMDWIEKHEMVCNAPKIFYEYLEKNYQNNMAVLIRHLKGSDFRLELAKRSLLKVVSWRVLNGIDYLTPTIVEDELKMNIIFSFGHTDKLGHALAYFRLSEQPLSDPWALVRGAAYIVV